jgi:integrase
MQLSASEIKKRRRAGAYHDGSKPLTAKKIAQLRGEGRYRDGLAGGIGLYLQVSASGAKSWLLRYELDGRERMLGLGSLSIFSLAQARERARAARRLIVDGTDPVEAKRQRRAAARLAAAKAKTFREAAQDYFNQHEKKWTNASHRDQFLSSLRSYAFPAIGDMDVANIAIDDVLRVIEPIWNGKNVTADRIRNRIENVLDWCMVRGHRPPGTNPAKWKGHLDQVLPALGKPKHHAAIGYRNELPAFMAALREQEEIAARAFEFLILTASRTGEVLGAKWDEIDFDSAMWVIPASRMKARREHRVPLSAAAVDLLRKLPHEDGNEHCFIGPKAGLGLGGMTLTRLLKRMGRSDITVHGFRSAFSDWAHESTAHANHVIELALAHNVGNEVERAYRRQDMFTKRVRIMTDWAQFCTSPSSAGEVVPIRGRR